MSCGPVLPPIHSIQHSQAQHTTLEHGFHAEHSSWQGIERNCSNPVIKGLLIYSWEKTNTQITVTQARVTKSQSEKHQVPYRIDEDKGFFQLEVK